MSFQESKSARQQKNLKKLKEIEAVVIVSKPSQIIKEGVS